MIEVIAVIFLFLSMVTLHELGHLILAKRAGVYCHEFSVGMGPKLYGFNFRNTYYSFRILPIGGFLRMAGRDDWSYWYNKTVYIHHTNGMLSNIYEVQNKNSYPVNLIKVDPKEGNVTFRSPGQTDEYTLKFLPSASIVTARNSRYPLLPDHVLFQSKTISQRICIFAAGPLANLVFSFFIVLGILFSIGMSEKSTVVIKQDKLESHTNITSQEGSSSAYSLKNGIKETYSHESLFINGFKRTVIGDDIQHKTIGPAGLIMESYYTVKEKGLKAFLVWVSIINMYLAIFNLLPFPALDGGRIFFLILEAIRRKPMESSKESLINLAGSIVLVLLMVATTWSDIHNFLA
ncbi:regulator of sigma E protease [Paenibacillus sp. PastF-3]|uniref:site-2 protease family protein n=1 Tax=Paenibacillus sp. PastF-3 TaxID=2940626 RepID=UPI0024753557|nr:site-2 protease family protein [Paenibacillus sp. PastF-3]MDH6372800.1 regulator of sigma E protease [Paenibacillus sp. PastF-3]